MRVLSRRSAWWPRLEVCQLRETVVRLLWGGGRWPFCAALVEAQIWLCFGVSSSKLIGVRSRRQSCHGSAEYLLCVLPRQSHRDRSILHIGSSGVRQWQQLIHHAADDPAPLVEKVRFSANLCWPFSASVRARREIRIRFLGFGFFGFAKIFFSVTLFHRVLFLLRQVFALYRSG